MILHFIGLLVTVLVILFTRGIQRKVLRDREYRSRALKPVVEALVLTMSSMPLDILRRFAEEALELDYKLITVLPLVSRAFNQAAAFNQLIAVSPKFISKYARVISQNWGTQCQPDSAWNLRWSDESERLRFFMDVVRYLQDEVVKCFLIWKIMVPNRSSSAIEMQIRELLDLPETSDAARAPLVVASPEQKLSILEYLVNDESGTRSAEVKMVFDVFRSTRYKELLRNVVELLIANPEFFNRFSEFFTKQTMFQTTIETLINFDLDHDIGPKRTRGFLHLYFKYCRGGDTAELEGVVGALCLFKAHDSRERAYGHSLAHEFKKPELFKRYSPFVGSFDGVAQFIKSDNRMLWGLSDAVLKKTMKTLVTCGRIPYASVHSMFEGREHTLSGHELCEVICNHEWARNLELSQAERSVLISQNKSGLKDYLLFSHKYAEPKMRYLAEAFLLEASSDLEALCRDDIDALIAIEAFRDRQGRLSSEMLSWLKSPQVGDLYAPFFKVTLRICCAKFWTVKTAHTFIRNWRHFTISEDGKDRLCSIASMSCQSDRIKALGHFFWSSMRLAALQNYFLFLQRIPLYDNAMFDCMCEIVKQGGDVAQLMDAFMRPNALKVYEKYFSHIYKHFCTELMPDLFTSVMHCMCESAKTMNPKRVSEIHAVEYLNLIGYLGDRDLQMIRDYEERYAADLNPVILRAHAAFSSFPSGRLALKRIGLKIKALSEQ